MIAPAWADAVQAGRAEDHMWLPVRPRSSLSKTIATALRCHCRELPGVADFLSLRHWQMSVLLV